MYLLKLVFHIDLIILFVCKCRWSVLTFLRITCFLLVLINIRKKVHNYAVIMNIEGAANDCVQIMLDFKVCWFV